MAYIIILPDPDWRHRCRHRGGAPDCACYPECPECGALYTPSEGHDCIDSELSKCDLLDIARELRDKLDAYETERDRIRTEVASLSAQVAEVPELTDAILDLACGPDISGKADMHSAAFRLFSRTQYRRGWEDLASRLVPTPIKPLQPEERRMGPDEVAVSREEWEALNAFLEDWRDPESRSLHDWNTSLKANAARINALRTSAQAHNGEESK